MKIVHFLKEGSPSRADSAQAAEARAQGHEYIFAREAPAIEGDKYKCDGIVTESKELAKRYKGVTRYVHSSGEPSLELDPSEELPEDE